MLAVIAILTPVGCWHLAAQALTLSGTLVNGANNRPLAGAEVSLQTEKWEPVGDVAISDAEGRFAFRGLAAGEYILSATVGGLGHVTYGEAPEPNWVHTIHLGRDRADKSIVFQVMPRASIEGVVRDEFGDPMMGAAMTVFRPVWTDGRTTLRSVAGKATDDRGRYRFGNLAPGPYLVCTNGSRGGNAPVPVPGTVDFAARADRYYVRTCYPAPGGSSPRTIQLAGGQHVQIDLTPLTGTAVTVRGRVRNLPSQTGPSGMMIGAMLQPEDAFEGASQSIGGVVDAAQGTIVFRSVPPGRYRLSANIGVPTQDGTIRRVMAEVPAVDVGGSDMDGVDVAFGAEGTVDVAVQGLAENLSFGLLSASSSRNAPGGQRADDGSYHFAGVPPGSYRLTAHTTAETCVQSVKLGDREVRGVPLAIAAGAALHLDVTVSKNCGGVRARAVREGEAVAGAKMVMLLSGTAKEPGEMKQDFTNDEGGLAFTGLTPGRYLLWAWAVEGKGAITGPESLAAVEQQATAVEVKEGEPVEIDVPLLKEEGQAQ
jgi:protocatechuate 3,4-dioxygenase beta subunit